MQLTGKEIIQNQIITNSIEQGLQQQGIDVRIKKINKLSGSGVIQKEGKTFLPVYEELQSAKLQSANDGWYLQPGYYEVEFEEGCNVPNNATLHFKTRSSLVRCGALVHSGQFDAGFKTDNMGAFLQVLNPILIQKGARVAQAIVFTSNEVSNLYDGQWQGDKQRK